jgi:hypothetical protein
MQHVAQGHHSALTGLCAPRALTSTPTRVDQRGAGVGRVGGGQAGGAGGGGSQVASEGRAHHAHAAHAALGVWGGWAGSSGVGGGGRFKGGCKVVGVSGERDLAGMRCPVRAHAHGQAHTQPQLHIHRHATRTVSPARLSSTLRLKSGTPKREGWSAAPCGKQQAVGGCEAAGLWGCGGSWGVAKGRARAEARGRLRGAWSGGGGRAINLSGDGGQAINLSGDGGQAINPDLAVAAT